MLFHGFYILSAEPLIVSYMSNQPFYKGLATEVQKVSQNAQSHSLPSWFRPKYVLEHIGGWGVPFHRMTRYKLKQTIHSLQGRSHYLIVNATDENAARQQFLMRGAQFSGSIYVNEHIYDVRQEPKLYDAIYTAQLTAFKRHELAQDVDQLMVVSYGGDLHTFCPALKHAEYNKEFLPRSELARKYNQSYSGLCLSEVEGAMFASCEYLLCGIPVVSTPSKGGRDEFFNEQNSIIVPPDSKAVAHAVQQWKNHPPDPQVIREQTLRQFNQLRLDYCAYIAELIRKGGGSQQSPEALMQLYFGSSNGMMSRFVKLEHLNESNLEKFCLT